MIKSKNILKQEEEFFKLNAEIESKTKDLMSQVDQIKEIQTNNEKLFSDWNVVEPITQIQSPIENENSLDLPKLTTPSKSSEGNFARTEYTFRRQDNDTVNSPDQKKDKSTRHLKLSHSAKITPSVVSAKEEDSFLALGFTRHKSDIKLKQGGLENDVIPETLRGVGPDAITRFLSAKVKILSEQVEVMQKDEKKHLEKIKELQLHKEKSTEDREKLLHQANISKNMLIKLEKHSENVSAQLQTAQTENNHLKKELETLKKEMRQSSKTHNTNEIKLNRTLQEVERLKAIIQQMKQDEREFKETQRKKTEDLSNTIKTLDRQRTELLNGFKKQLLVIDNLKRQKGLFEAGKLLKSAEDDFINYLDCNQLDTVCHSDTIKSVKGSYGRVDPIMSCKTITDKKLELGSFSTRMESELQNKKFDCIGNTSPKSKLAI